MIYGSTHKRKLRMSTENPNTLTDAEAVAEYLAGSRSDNDLSSKQMEMAIESYNNPQGEANTQEAPVENVDLPNSEDTPTPKELDLPKDPNVIARDALAKANTEKQRAENLEKQIERLKNDREYRNEQLGIENPVDEYLDLLADENLGKIPVLERKLARMEADANARAERDKAFESKKAQDAATDNVFSEIDRLGEKFPTLKTSMNFRELDTKYTSWRNAMGAERVEKYLSDPAYRVEVDKTNFNPGINFDDMGKAMKIFDAYDNYQQIASTLKEGYSPSFEDAFSKTAHYEDAIKNKFGGHFQANETALNQRVAEISAEARTINTTTASEVSNDVNSMMAELDVLSSLARPKSTEEVQRMNDIGLYLDKVLAQ